MSVLFLVLDSRKPSIYTLALNLFFCIPRTLGVAGA